VSNEKRTLTLIGGQGDTPVLTPVTRRVPPAGYCRPAQRPVNVRRGDDADEDLAVPTLQDAARLTEARVAVGRAISHYRWWGFTSLVIWFRLWLQSRRFK